MVNPALLEILGGYSAQEAMQLDPGTQIYSNANDRDTLIDVLRRSGKMKGWETTSQAAQWRVDPGAAHRSSDSLPPMVSLSVLNRMWKTSRSRAAWSGKCGKCRKLEAVGRLAGGMAHDFNNVLVVIKLSTEMMLGQITPDSPFSKPLLQISNAADRAAALTKQMLAFSRQQMMQPRIINLNRWSMKPRTCCDGNWRRHRARHRPCVRILKIRSWIPINLPRSS